MLALALICALAATAFAASDVPSAEKSYDYGDVRMIHRIYGHPNYATAWIKFVVDDGSNGETPANISSFDYDGRISYIYGPEGCRPNERTGATSNRSGRAYDYYVSLSAGNLSGSDIMYSASMRFSVTFDLANATVNHNNPDTVTVYIN